MQGLVSAKALEASPNSRNTPKTRIKEVQERLLPGVLGCPLTPFFSPKIGGQWG